MSGYIIHIRRIPLLFLLAAALPAMAADEPYYTWVDENGVVNFAEQNPKNVDAIYVTRDKRFGAPVVAPAGDGGRPGKVEVPEPSPAEEAATAVQDGDEAAPGDEPNANLDAQMAEERAKIQADIAKARAANCEMGKRNLARLEAYSRIRIREADGSERVLSDAEKQERTESARKTIAENCGPG